MLINKTADECIVEMNFALFQCFIDTNLTTAEKKACIKWISLFLKYQDAIIENNQNQITYFQEKLSTNFTTEYYKNALKEFKNVNLIYNNMSSLANLKNISLDYSTQNTINTINEFNDVFTKQIEKYKSYFQNYDLKVIFENFWLLFYIVHYHLGYNFKNALVPIISVFSNIIKTPVFIEKDDSHVKMPLIQIILQENKDYFEQIKPIQLINFVHSLDDVFLQPIKINKQIEKLILRKPHKIKVTMNMLFIKHNLILEKQIWNGDNPNIVNSNIIMHLFAYETYYIQGFFHHEIYEDMILNKLFSENKNYEKIFQEYKQQNHINRRI